MKLSIPDAANAGRAKSELHRLKGATMRIDVIEYKSYDDRKRERPAANRAFCGDCFKPLKMLDDDLADILAKDAFCHCRRRGHA